MEMAWTTVCPDEEMGDDYTVGDPVEPQNAIVPIKQKENPVVPENFGLSEK